MLTLLMAFQLPPSTTFVVEIFLLIHNLFIQMTAPFYKGAYRNKETNLEILKT